MPVVSVGYGGYGVFKVLPPIEPVVRILHLPEHQLAHLMSRTNQGSLAAQRILRAAMASLPLKTAVHIRRFIQQELLFDPERDYASTLVYR